MNRLIYLWKAFSPHQRLITSIHTSSKGRVSLKQLSHTSLTTRSAVAASGQAGLPATTSAARRRTQAWKIKHLSAQRSWPKIHGLTWCCFEKAKNPRLSSRLYRQSPLKLLARICSEKEKKGYSSVTNQVICALNRR